MPRKALLSTVAAQHWTRQIVSRGAGSPVIDNAAGATTIDIPWVTTAGSVAANVLTFMAVALKPGTANLGSVTTPAGWTLVGSHIGGGYGGTLGTGTGNVRVYLFSKQDNTNTGSVTVSLTPDGANGAASGAMCRVEKLFGGWQTIVTATGEATVDTNNATYIPTALQVARGDCLIHAFGGVSSTGTTLTAGAATDLAGWSPSLAVAGLSVNGYNVSITMTGRRALRGVAIGNQTLSSAPGAILRGPMLVARLRVR